MFHIAIYAPSSLLKKVKAKNLKYYKLI